MNSILKLLFFSSLLSIIFTGCIESSNHIVEIPKGAKSSKKFDYNITGVTFKKTPSSINEFIGITKSYNTFALEKLISDINLFDKNSQNKIRIEVTLIEDIKSFPGLFLAVDADTKLEYTILNEKNNILYQEIISSHGETGNYERMQSLNGYILAHDRSIKNNMKSFVNSIMINLKNAQNRNVKKENTNNINKWR